MCDSGGIGDFTVLRQNPDDRYNFLKMAKKHLFFSSVKDIRLYLAKWFFYDVVDVVEKLMELARQRYGITCPDYILRQQCIIRVKKTITDIKNTPLFAEILYKPWFWGCRSNTHDGYPYGKKQLRNRVYLGKQGLFYVFSDFNQEKFYQIEVESLKQLIKFMDEAR